jgi:hypothetical protein
MSGTDTEHGIPSVELEVHYKEGSDRIRSDVCEVASQLCPWAKGLDESRLATKEIRGGITNLLYCVYDRDHAEEEDYAALVRIFGEKTEVLIDREKDNRMSNYSDMCVDTCFIKFICLICRGV